MRSILRRLICLGVLFLWAPWAHATLTSNGDDTVSDSVTGLMWDLCPHGLSGSTCSTGTLSNFTWTNALAAVVSANSANHRGYNDWRLPNIKELQSIVNRGANSPAFYSVFPDVTAATRILSSTTNIQTPGDAVGVNRTTGSMVASAKGNLYWFRLVRGGQTYATFDLLAPINGACGSASNASLVTTAPSANLCSTGTPTAVTSSTASYTWGCNGSNGGTSTAATACSAGRGYTVTPSAGANGSISPNTAQVVAYNATPSFTVTPSGGYTASVGGSCGGSLSGGTYTTSAVSADCTVSASFAPSIDTTPDAFSFTAQTGVAVSSVATSNTITVSGINAASAISVTNGQYQIGAGAWTSAAGNVNNGDTVTVRHTASAAYATVTTTTLDIGGVTADFSSTTVAAPINGSCGSASNATLVTTAPSANLCSTGTPGSVTTGTSTYTWSCAGLNGGSTDNSCSAGHGYTVTPSAGANGSISPNTAQVVAYNATPSFTVTPSGGYTASASGCGGSLSGSTYTTGAITAACTVSASFTPIPDTTPDAFSFTAQTDVALSSVVTSNTITVAGINTAATISVTNGEYRIASGAWTSTAGNVNNGDTVTVRHTASAAYTTVTTTTLDIGGVTANFSSTTVPPPTNGACGSASNATLVTSAPSSNLCSAGTPTAVTTGTSTYTWGCTGLNGGSTDNTCSAGHGYTVTASAGANGSISPSGAQVVAYNAQPTFTVTPSGGYTASVGGSCGGNLSGSTYTTNAVTTACTVAASFADITAPTVTGPSISTGPSHVGATLSVTANEAGTGYWVLVPTGSTAPSAAEVQAGVNYGGVTVVAANNLTLVANTAASITLSGLNPSTAYVLYFVAQDAAGNPSSVASLAVTTLAAPIHGACGSASNATLVTTAPSSNLCATGTATAVTPGTSTYTWGCNGQNGGTSTAANACSAGHGYTVTASAGANGSISPSGVQVVAYNAQPSFTVSANSGHTASVGGTCGGALSSGTYTATAVTASCTVSASFALNTDYSGASLGGAGTVTTHLAGAASCGYTTLTYQSAASAGGTLPAGYTFPHGVVNFTTNSGCGTGLTVTLTYPSALPAGAKFFKYGPATAGASPTWYEHPATISGNTITYSVSDNGQGDNDNVLGVIADPGGPGVPGGGVSDVPTLSQWALMLLAGLMGLLVVGRPGRLDRRR
jgi:hypothetical protein